MNKLKIILSTIVIVSILAGTIFWIQSNQTIPPIKKVENQFTREIEKEIASIKIRPDNQFCKENYLLIVSHINDWYKPAPPQHPFGRFGKNQLENDQWKEDLERNLYAAYSDKFIKQAKYVFRGTQWNPSDLAFIQVEKNRLKISKLLASGSTVDKEFSSIQAALNKYNEITGFIYSCKGYSFINTDIQASFPIETIQVKLNRSSVLQKNNLENVYVNNCERLRRELKEVPKYLLNAHVNYLNNKINQLSNKWCDCGSHKEYTLFLHNRIKNEINDLSNTSIYVGMDIDSKCALLYSRWAADNLNAYNSKYPC